MVRSADIAIRYAPDAIPRLTVVSLPPGGLPGRDYDLFLTLDSPSGETRLAQRGVRDQRMNRGRAGRSAATVS